jgi:hypothetical protein
MIYGSVRLVNHIRDFAASNWGGLIETPQFRFNLGTSCAHGTQLDIEV